MLKFYDIDVPYADYLRRFDNRIPNITYGTNNKFVCGIVLMIGGYEYFAPISSNKTKQQTNMLILDETGNTLASIKFCFMFPAPTSVTSVKDFKAIRASDPAYADLLAKEYGFCKKHEQDIRDKAAKIYKIGCNPNHKLHNNCCDFNLLESKQDEWVLANSVADKEISEEQTTSESKGES